MLAYHCLGAEQSLALPATMESRLGELLQPLRTWVTRPHLQVSHTSLLSS